MSSRGSRRPKNKLGLKLNVNCETQKTDNANQVTKVEIDENERMRLMAFLADKGKITDPKKTDFTRLKEIGFGSAGIVYKVQHNQTALIMAQKIIRLDVKQQVRTQIVRELQVLHECNSPYIVGYFGAFQDEGEINILMEYMDCGSFDKICKKVKRVPVDILSKITKAVINFCNEGRLILPSHQSSGDTQRFLTSLISDIKPSNILLNSNGEIKVCDFGVSGKLIDSMANTFVGTRSYMAPERLKGSEYTVRSDIWSLGVVIVELATGRYPYPPIPLEKLELLYKNDCENPEEELAMAPEKDLSLFELLGYIVDSDPPRLLEPFFSHDISDFKHAFVTKYPEISVTDWIQKEAIDIE
ncbi:hypothetical protein MXB_4652 [Myxobolus squamalis]|nr:hypothetical protein MXB_4652 [Myxobolus squamalis]